MTTSKTVERPQILFCNCAHYEIIPRAAKEQIRAGLREAGLEVQFVDDLCGLAAIRDPRLPTWAAAPALAVVACFPRAIRWLFHAAGVPLSNDRIRFFNMRTHAPEEILSELSVLRSVGWASAHADDPRALRKEQHGLKPILQTDNCQLPTVPWVPWFPVIDYDRCKNCKQCLNFCLFGVYQLSPEGKVTVHNPAGCKTNCPACARMCPQKAIIFPKYAEAPINGDDAPAVIADCGLPIADSSRSGNQQSEIPNPQSNDLYDRIRQRGAGRKRFSTEPKEGAAPGPSCPTLEGLRRELGIPDDVLAALSPAELQRAMARKSPGQPQPDGSPSDAGKDKEHHD